MQCKHLAYESTIYKDTLVITVCSLVWKARRQHCSVTTITHIPPSHVPRIAPGALVCRTPPNTQAASPALPAAATLEQLRSPWELSSQDTLHDLCSGFFACRLKKLLIFKKKKNNNFFLNLALKGDSLKLEKAAPNENWERNEGKVVG